LYSQGSRWPHLEAVPPGDPSLIAIARPVALCDRSARWHPSLSSKTPIKGTLTRTNQHEAFATNCVILASHPNERVGCH
jgi:hypothetical protein